MKKLNTRPCLKAVLFTLFVLLQTLAPTLAFGAEILIPSPSPGPTISSFCPTGGAISQPVTLLGKNLDQVTSVYFGDVKAGKIHKQTPTSLCVNVPMGAKTDKLTINYGSGNSTVAVKTADNFTVFTSWNFNEPANVYAWPNAYLPANGKEAFLNQDYLADFDPSQITAPPIDESSSGSSIFAARGEIEPASFLMVAPAELPMDNVQITPNPLWFGDNKIPASNILVRRVVRTPLRKFYTKFSSPTDFTIAGRFLPRWSTQTVPAGEFRQIWLSVKVPGGTMPGKYTGHVSISFNQKTRSWPLSVDVLPVRLLEDPHKSHGIYYPFADRIMTNKITLAKAELQDMGSHGIRSFSTGIEIAFTPTVVNGKVTYATPNLTLISSTLDLLNQSPYPWRSVVFKSGLDKLAQLLGHNDIFPNPITKKCYNRAVIPAEKPCDGSSLDGDTVFLSIAMDAMNAFHQLKFKYPKYDLMLSTLDEIFTISPGDPMQRVAIYKRLVGACRQPGGPNIKLSVTYSTFDRKDGQGVSDNGVAEDKLRHEVDPFVDVRINHGYSFEGWLARQGHSTENAINAYRAEINSTARSSTNPTKDRAWFYHNDRGAYSTSEFVGLINGVWLWNSPFSMHMPWTYQTATENPFDDSDGTCKATVNPDGSYTHDFGFSFSSFYGSTELVPTRMWEAMREGWDDIRYFHTLDIARARWLPEDLNSKVDAFFGKLYRSVNGIDLNAYVKSHRIVTGKASEAPLISALTEKMKGCRHALRKEAADLLVCIYNGQKDCNSVPGVTSESNSDGSVTATITGNGFTEGDSVTVCGTRCSHVVVDSPTQLSCTLPSGAIPLVGITVSRP